MFDFPPNLIRATQKLGRDKLDALLEYRLSPLDVAALLRVTPNTVRTYSTDGLKGIVLQHRRFPQGRGVKSLRAYRLSDVRRFAEIFGKHLDYDTLHPMLQREWKVGSFGSPNEQKENQ